MKMFLICFDVQGSKAELEKHLKSKMYEHLDMSALHASQLDARNLELTKKLQKETRKAEQQEAIIYDQGIFMVTFHSRLHFIHGYILFKVTFYLRLHFI